MITIAELLVQCGLQNAFTDKGLSWGAKASAYERNIRDALNKGKTPVLIELEDDLPADISCQQLLHVDHHNERAGADVPSSLQQVYKLLPVAIRPPWSRHYALVETNDRGHADGMRQIGASKEEIRAIRDADRKAQGITEAVEAESRRAIEHSRLEGNLRIVETSAPTASAITDFLLPEYGALSGGGDNILVIMPGSVGFYGAGKVIENLRDVSGCWYGGGLPQKGFWGAPRTSVPDRNALITRIIHSLQD